MASFVLMLPSSGVLVGGIARGGGGLGLDRLARGLNWAAALALALITLGVPRVVFAMPTTILPNSSGEPSLVTPGGILDLLYGLGNLTMASDSADAIWQNLGTATATVQGKYAGYTEVFGYIPGASGGSFVPLFDVTQNGGTNGPSGQFTVGQSGFDFRFAIDPNGAGVDPGIWSSIAGENADQMDHMVTWLITGNAGHPGNEIGAYVIAFEDLPIPSSDKDYNDLVVEVRGVRDAVVPEPSALLLLGSGVVMLAGVGWRRRRRG
jgi:hypothetical protein